MKTAALMLAFATLSYGCLEVSGDRVLAKDVAKTIPGFDRIAAETDLGAAPAAGSRRILSRTALERVAGIPIASTEDICVQRASQVLNEKMLVELLHKINPSVDAVVDYPRGPLPQGSIEFLGPGPGSAGIWRGIVKYGGSRTIPIWAKVRMSGAQVEGKGKQPGSKSKDVEAGDSVRVEVIVASVRIVFDATAQSGGMRGDTILLHNPINGSRFQGRVDAGGRIVIQR